VAADVAQATSSAVVGIDPSEAQAKRLARQRSELELSSSQAAAEALPFRAGSFDALYSSCALKHWPSASRGLAECARVCRPGAPVVIVEIDGGSTPAVVRTFTRLTHVPPGLREAYVRFAMRTVVGVAPGARALAAMFDGVPMTLSTVEKIPTLPFLMARAIVA
jgi:ubiquinone/menaquinone biosynthesis C-methylase UbiE